MLPVQITLRDIPASESIESHIHKRAEKLNRYHSRISSCRVVIDTPQKHKHQGKLYNVRIDITVPGKELAATHKCDQDVYVAIRDAFDAIERQLDSHADKQSGHVKTHDNIMQGRVVRLVESEGYGFIDGADGHEYYFSVTNVSHPSFDQLLVGDVVEYVAQPLSEGRQAHHVIKGRSNNER